MVDLFQHLLRPRSQSNEANVHLVKPVEIGIGGELGIEDKLFGVLSGSALPELYKSEDLICLLILAQIGVAIAEHALLCVLDHKCKNPLLTATSFGYVMLAGFLCWFGFYALLSLMMSLFEQKPNQLWLINASYVLVAFLISGGILAAWK